MTPFLYVMAGSAISLALLLVWLLGRPARDARKPWNLEDNVSHIQYFPQMSQAISSLDERYLRSRGRADLARALRVERRNILFTFLAALQEEFRRLTQLARVIVSLSPEVAPAQEFARFRLHLAFLYRLQVVRAKLRLGAQALPELGEASNLVSAVRVRMDAAMKELGERAALAAEMASALDRGNSNLG
jgi:hypothetical protein